MDLMDSYLRKLKKVKIESESRYQKRAVEFLSKLSKSSIMHPQDCREAISDLRDIQNGSKEYLFAQAFDLALWIDFKVNGGSTPKYFFEAGRVSLQKVRQSS